MPERIEPKPFAEAAKGVVATKKTVESVGELMGGTGSTTTTYAVASPAGANFTNLYPVIDKFYGSSAGAKVYKTLYLTGDDGTKRELTVLSSKDPFIYNRYSGLLKDADITGCCGGCEVDNLQKRGLSLSAWNKATIMKSIDSNIFPRGWSSLTNCVGWANARVVEIWTMAVVGGLVTYDGTGYCLNGKPMTDANGQRVVTGILPDFKYGHAMTVGLKQDLFKSYFNLPDDFFSWPGRNMPTCSAADFNTQWLYPSGGNQTPGWYMSPGGKSSLTNRNWVPLPGAICSWDDGGDGHVAVVEEVHNIGTDQEYIIVSESGWNYSWVSDDKVVITKKINRYGSPTGTAYAWSNAYPLKYMLFSPACLISGTTSFSWDVVAPSSESINAYVKYKLNQASAFSNYTELFKNEAVTIIENRPGNTKSDGSGKKVLGFYNTDGKVTNYIANSKYPYEVSTDKGDVIGWFERSVLKPIDGEQYEDYEL